MGALDDREDRPCGAGNRLLSGRLMCRIISVASGRSTSSVTEENSSNSR